jgi:hypothetical protein
MRFKRFFVLCFALVIFANGRLFAEDYLKDGKLSQTLKIVELQGGFAGYTGTQFVIAPDGAWTFETIFNQKTTPKDKGKLSEKELAKLAGILEKYDLAKLPAESGKPPGANPHTVKFEFGKQTANFVGQVPPKVDSKNPTATAESRFAGILEGVVGMLAPAPKGEKKD